VVLREFGQTVRRVGVGRAELEAKGWATLPVEQIEMPGWDEILRYAQDDNRGKRMKRMFEDRLVRAERIRRSSQAGECVAMGIEEVAPRLRSLRGSGQAG